MVDSITLILHDLKKHELILNSIRTITSGFRKFDSSDNDQLSKDLNRLGGTLNHEITYFEDSSKFKEKMIFRSRHQPSSHYKVIFMVDIKQDLITFSFSVPKYFYGHNIAQAICNTNEVDFSMINSDINHHVKNGFPRLIKYIKTYFSNEFPACPFDMRELELSRIDFCYNQIFKSKSDALEYLEFQRGIRKKHLRDNSTKSNNYQTSIHYSNKDYSVKIYHKGTEYSKNDKQEHIKINRVSHKFDVDYLQEFSDKILRYEITLRPSYMSYIYNQKLFRNESKQFKTWKLLYNKIKSKNKELENKKFSTQQEKNRNYEDIYNQFRNKIDKKTMMPMFEWLYFHYYKKQNETPFTFTMICKLINNFYKDFDALIHTRRRFYLDLNHINKQYYFDDHYTNDNKFNTYKIVPFTQDLYELCNKKLLDFYLDMKVDEKKSLSHYIKEIDLYNSRIDDIRKKQKGVALQYKMKTDTKIDKAKLGMILASLDKYDLTYLQNLLGLDRSTIYRYTQQLKKIGYTKNTIDTVNITVPDFDFRTYFVETMLNSKKIFINNFFRFK